LTQNIIAHVTILNADKLEV